MPEGVTQGLDLLIRILEIVGASALVLGFIVATISWSKRLRQRGVLPALGQYRQELGRAVLIGLEILVAATIIKTITIHPSVENMGLLIITVVIRTLLGWTTVLEISGRWPWQKPKANPSKS